MNPTDVPVRFSHLKAMARSPAHYLHAIQQGRPDSAAMLRGRLVHTDVLGGMPDDEDGRVVVYEGERRGNAWKAFKQEHDGDEIVTRAEWDAHLPIGAAVRNDPIASKYLRGDFEFPIKWAIGSRRCSSRPDIIVPGEYIADLKTTTDASRAGFKKQAWKMMYHAQLAFYRQAALSIGIECPDAYLIAVEVKPPYIVSVFKLKPRLLKHGERLCGAWFNDLRVCEDSNEWPGYLQTVDSFDMPDFFEEPDGKDDDDDEEDEAAAE